MPMQRRTTRERQQQRRKWRKRQQFTGAVKKLLRGTVLMVLRRSSGLSWCGRRRSGGSGRGCRFVVGFDDDDGDGDDGRRQSTWLVVSGGSERREDVATRAKEKHTEERSNRCSWLVVVSICAVVAGVVVWCCAEGTKTKWRYGRKVLQRNAGEYGGTWFWRGAAANGELRSGCCWLLGAPGVGPTENCSLEKWGSRGSWP
jgi:hypothetical protein